MLHQGIKNSKSDCCLLIESPSLNQSLLDPKLIEHLYGVWVCHDPFCQFFECLMASNIRFEADIAPWDFFSDIAPCDFFSLNHHSENGPWSYHKTFTVQMPSKHGGLMAFHSQWIQNLNSWTVDVPLFISFPECIFSDVVLRLCAPLSRH